MIIDDKYKFVARDKNGMLCAFTSRPEKTEKFGHWNNVGGKKYAELKDDGINFNFVKWEDEKPHEINKPNMVNKPNHYIGINGLEVEEVLQNFIPKYEDSYVAHRIASSVEYLLRSPLKNGLEDIKKAKQNLEQIIAFEEKENEKFNERWVVETETINKRLAQKQAIDTFMGGAPQ